MKLSRQILSIEASPDTILGVGLQLSNAWNPALANFREDIRKCYVIGVYQKAWPPIQAHVLYKTQSAPPMHTPLMKMIAPAIESFDFSHIFTRMVSREDSIDYICWESLKKFKNNLNNSTISCGQTKKHTVFCIKCY